MLWRLLLLSVLVVVLVDDVVAYYTKTYTTSESVTKGEQCTYRKYEGGDGSVSPISPMPTVEASVPTTALADLFGKANAGWLKKADLAANGWMHMGNALKANFGMFAKIAPKLGPCLGVLGVGFGFVNREWNSVKPKQIMAEVNKAIKRVVDQTNKRFELFEEMVDDKLRKLMEEAMKDDYRGQFETWQDCVEFGSAEKVNDCQVSAAMAASRTKYKFMFQNKFEGDNNGDVILGNDDIKALELQLPLLKRWADFHLLVLGVLVKTYEGNDDILYNKYRLDLIDEGTYYISYMQWALRRITRARFDDQPKTPQLTCSQGYEKDWSFCFTACRGLMSSKFLDWTSQKCEFKASSLKASYCYIKGMLTCRKKKCFIGEGVPWRSTDDRNVWKYQGYIHDGIQEKANQIVEAYNTQLKKDFDAFWRKEIKLFIPKIRQVIKVNELAGGESGKREETPEEGKEELSAEEKKKQKKLDDLRDKCEKENAEVLTGVTANLSLVDYLERVKDNIKIADKKKDWMKGKNSDDDLLRWGKK